MTEYKHILVDGDKVQVDSAFRDEDGKRFKTQYALKSEVSAKQDILTFDSTPTSGSTNPVTSGGVKTALDGKQNTLTFDSAPTVNSTNPVTSGGIYTQLGTKQDNLTFADIELEESD